MSAPGVARFDLACGPRSRDDTVELVRRWGRDRALSTCAMDHLCLLTATALAHGSRFQPRSVTVSLRWADADRVRVDVQWHGLGGACSDVVAENELRATTEIMDTVADSWGFDRGSTPAQWMVLDTSPHDPGPDRRPR